jgi:hypothetical protein
MVVGRKSSRKRLQNFNRNKKYTYNIQYHPHQCPKKDDPPSKFNSTLSLTYDTFSHQLAQRLPPPVPLTHIHRTNVGNDFVFQLASPASSARSHRVSWITEVTRTHQVLITLPARLHQVAMATGAWEEGVVEAVADWVEVGHPWFIEHPAKADIW